MALKKFIKWTGASLAAIYAASVLQNTMAHLEDHKDFQFPDQTILHPQGAPSHTKRMLNPLWAPTSYLQGIDCEQDRYRIKDLKGTYVDFTEYEIGDSKIRQDARESSLGYSVYLSQSGHAIINFKAIGKPFETNKHEQAHGIVKDVLSRDEQADALEKLIQNLLKDEKIKTIETVGFAQGAAKVYYLAEHYNILGTIISDTGTDFDSEHLKNYVIALDPPGDIHSFPFIGSTGENKPAYVMPLGSAHDFDRTQLYTPVATSWVEKIQTMAFQFPEAQAPEGYQDEGVKLANPDKVCNNPTMDND